MAKTKPRKKPSAVKSAGTTRTTRKPRTASAPTTASAAKLPGRRAGAKPPGKASRPGLKQNENGVVLLSGGNPQVAKAEGDAAVQHYIANMPGWKSAQGRKLDALVTRLVPHVQKAVKWNSPFYGIAGQGWFLVFHVFTNYIKVTFLKGRSLKPPPPVPSKDPHARYVHIEEGGFDERQMTDWIEQAAAIPGWIP